MEKLVARSVSSRIRFFSSAVKIRRCGLAATSGSTELATKGTAILASLTMFLLAALLCNYGRGNVSSILARRVSASANDLCDQAEQEHEQSSLTQALS